MPFKTPNKTSEYIRSIMREEDDEVYKEVCRYADEQYVPILLPESAQVLKQIIMLSKPKKILEIGTAIGFSALVMLKNSDAQLYTIEMDETRVRKAKEYFKKANVDKRAYCFVGDAGEIVPQLTGSYDFIFMDGPKTRYIEYLPYLKRLLTDGGILLCDNVLFNGMVSGEEELEKKKTTIVEAIEKFLTDLYNDKDYTTSIIPVGDGMSLSIKKKVNL